MKKETFFSLSKKHILKSECLEVDLFVPHSTYTGVRFDWTGLITQVTFEGKHTYCTSETMKDEMGTGGIGLSNEFGIYTPVGYYEIQPGQKFMKIGVGLLTRPDGGPYDFFRKYELNPFMKELKLEKDSIEFYMDAIPCNGYAVDLKKVISVSGNRLKIEYSLINKGEKPIFTEEYTHNFLSINRNDIDSKYHLEIKSPVEYGYRQGDMRISDTSITWDETPNETFYCRSIEKCNFDSLRWELTHDTEGVGVREYGDFPADLVAVWGMAHVVSPEIYCRINVKPGNTQEWTREYEFFRY